MRLPVVESEEAHPWYAAGLSFSCTQCGNCCTGEPGYVWISEAEVSRLAEFLKLPEAEVVRKYCRRMAGGKFSLKERKNLRNEYDCIFLKEDEKGRRGCSIYPVRPLQCRTWPFWEGNLSGPNAWNRAGKKCPGLNKGRKFTREQIESLRDAEDWPSQPPGSEP